MDPLEQIALDAYLPLYGDDAVTIGGAVCLRAPHAPDSPMLNRIVGLGVDSPLDEETVDRALDAMGDAAFYAAVAPAADPQLDRLLDARGLEHGWGWMLFERRPTPPRRAETSLVVTEVDDGNAGPWAAIVAKAYDLPDASRGVFETVPSLPGWTAFLALEGDEPAAAAAVWIGSEDAYLGLAATLPEHRGKGGQGALFAARIERAVAAGCRRLVTETGELRDDRPNASYRNILRQGFEGRHVVAHRFRPRRS